MNQYDKTNSNGIGTIPKFNKRMFFCVSIDTIHAALEDCFRNDLPQGSIKQQKQMSEDLIRNNYLDIAYKYKNSLAQRQDETIKVLEKQIADLEEELYEKDKKIFQLENVLEMVYKEFSEVSQS